MKWPSKFGKIIKYSEKRVQKFGFNNETSTFLITTGLPEEATPFMGFSKDNDKQYDGLMKITDYFDFLDSDFDKYVVIGFNGYGDNIVIDLIDECSIKYLNHDNNYSEVFINSSIVQFAKALMLYRDFIDTEIHKNNEINLINGLKEKMIENDLNSSESECFWNKEMVSLIRGMDVNH